MRGSPNISRARTPYSGCSGNLRIGVKRQIARTATSPIMLGTLSARWHAREAPKYHRRVAAAPTYGMAHWHQYDYQLHCATLSTRGKCRTVAVAGQQEFTCGRAVYYPPRSRNTICMSAIGGFMKPLVALGSGSSAQVPVAAVSSKVQTSSCL